jgi:hypothetical protein
MKPIIHRKAAPDGRFYSDGRANKISPTDLPPSSSAGLGVQTEFEQTTIIYDYFTKAGETKLLYSAVGWVEIRLLLQNAGPVSIGTKADILPVLGGSGRLLPTNQEIWFRLAKGTRLYIAADAVNRVSITIEPIAYGEAVVNLLNALRR